MTELNDCWYYAGYKNELGYGQIFTYINRKSGYQYAHRVSYESFVGTIPEGLVIDHLCRVRCCINPDHLEPVTSRENVMRGECGSFNNRKKYCRSGHQYTSNNTIVNSHGFRICRECKRKQQARYYRENKQKFFEYTKKSRSLAKR